MTKQEFDRGMAQDVKALTGGTIDYHEYQQRAYARNHEFWLPVLMRHRQAGDWDEFIRCALDCPEVMADAFEFFDEIPDPLKYDFAIEAYTHHGDSVPAVRKAVRRANRWGRPELPKELEAAREITVYRAGEEPMEKAKYRLSWTTDVRVARFFLDTYGGRHANHLYTGKIRPRHIIAYTDAREEKEIIQYGHVYDITSIN